MRPEEFHASELVSPQLAALRERLWTPCRLGMATTPVPALPGLLSTHWRTQTLMGLSSAGTATARLNAYLEAQSAFEALDGQHHVRVPLPSAMLNGSSKE